MLSSSNTLSSFQIRTVCGHTINHDIEYLDRLVEFIELDGLDAIAKVSFYFQNPQHIFHNLILRRDSDTGRFTAEFMSRHTIDACGNWGELISILSETEERRDITAVLNAIYAVPGLIPLFGEYIDNPYANR